MAGGGGECQLADGKSIDASFPTIEREGFAHKCYSNRVWPRRTGMPETVQPHILVVDDDPGILEGLQRLLQLHAYEPILFSSAEAFKNHTDFEQAVCVILDINLSDGSGIDLRHRLTAAGISLPVIYITGNDNPAVRMAALASGCIAYLTKPFAARSLLEPIEKASAGLA